jgi:DNA-binding CsgD family transcriptional regulator
MKEMRESGKTFREIAWQFGAKEHTNKNGPERMDADECSKHLNANF